MFASGVITFREALEAALVIGIILSFLTNTKQQFYKKYVWRGAFGGITLSLLLAVLLKQFFGGLSGITEEIFEGVLMFLTAGFLTWMILWVHKQKEVTKRIKTEVAKHVENKYSLGIFILALTSVLREGVETVLYLQATSLTGFSNQFIGALIGLVLALVMGVAIFKWAMRFNLSVIFNVTSVFLLLFAAGLVSHGVHEFQEASILPVFSFDPVFNISQILDHKNNLIGTFLRSMFGYTSRPTYLEMISYTSYIVFIYGLNRLTDYFLKKRIVVVSTK